MPSFGLILSPVNKQQRPVGKTDISIAAVNDVSANEALGSEACIDEKTAANATCDTNEVRPVNLMHVSPVKNPVHWSRVSKKAKKRSIPRITVITTPLEDLHEGCAVDPGGDAIPVDRNKVCAKVHGEVSVEKQVLKASLKASNHLLQLLKHMMQQVLERPEVYGILEEVLGK